MPNPREWEDVLRSIAALRDQLFMLIAPTQPLTTLETLRAEFLQLVQAFLQAPTREAAIKAEQLAKQIMELAQQTPGFDRPSFVFRELVAQLTEGLAAIETVIKAQRPPEIERDREEIKQLCLRQFGSEGIPKVIDQIEEMFSEGPTDPTRFATYLDRGRALIIEICKRVAQKVGDLKGKTCQGDWNNERAVLDYLARNGIRFLSQQEKGLVSSIYGLASDRGAHRIIGEREYARISKNITYELLLLMLEKLEKWQSGDQEK